MTEKALRYFRDWRRKNVNRVKAYKRKYYYANLDKEKNRRQQWWKSCGAAYHKKHPEYGRVYHHNRRLQLKSLEKLGVAKIQKAYEQNIARYGTLTCYLCLEPVVFGQDSIDHKMPLTRGGDNNLGNIDIAHRLCNSRKYNKTPLEYWMAQI